jgi:glucose/arabinose dehydrogenase
MVSVLAALLLVGCSGTRDASTEGAGAADDAIRVLMVTTTHGERHADAIEASRDVMAGLDDEFVVDMTEDVTDLTAANLEEYDVLFLANATLQAANDFSPEELEASYDPMNGSWGNFDVAYEGGRGDAEASLAVWGEPGALNGFILFGDDPEPTELTDVRVDGDSLFLSWPAGNAGSVEVAAALVGEGLSGTVSFRDQQMPLTGTRTGPDRREIDGPAVTAEIRRALLDFVNDGKGIVVAHAGLDALHDWDAYRTLVGSGLAEEEAWIQNVRVLVEDPDNPSVSHFGEAFEVQDGFYRLDENPRWNARVLASIDTEALLEDNAPAGTEINDFPVSWVRRHNGGRVFVTTLGHAPETWRNEGFQRHLLQGIRMVAGEVNASFGGYRVKEVVAPDVWPDDISVDERGNVWIAELRGEIHRYDAESGETQLIAEIPTTDPTGIEHGIYGIETDPSFYDGEPYVYVFYAERHTFLNKLSRFEYRDGQLDLSTEQEILVVPTEPQCCHQAGDLEWGPDGTLYVSTGDTGYSGTRPQWEISEERVEAFQDRYDLDGYHWSRIVDSERTSQNLSELRGKILRINKDGTIPKDNPFYGRPGVRWEIFAYGLRNPYRFKVDDDGGVYIGVVGPDAQYDYDEYNLAYGGENFGWPRSLGRLFHNEWTADMIEDYAPPFWEYTYATGSRSATVGPIYRFEGQGAFPEFLQDKVFVFDWSRRWIKYGEVVDGTFVNDQESDVKTAPPYRVEIPAKRLTNVKMFEQLTMTTPISMELGPDGSIYVAEYAGFWDPDPAAQVTRYRWVSEEE